jgi:hypothetical protein
MVSCKPASTPLASSTKISAHDGDLLSNATKYHSIVGAWQYLTLTWQDIAFSVNKVCQYLSTPRTSIGLSWSTFFTFSSIHLILVFSFGHPHPLWSVHFWTPIGQDAPTTRSLPAGLWYSLALISSRGAPRSRRRSLDQALRQSTRLCPMPLSRWCGTGHPLRIICSLSTECALMVW